MNLVNKLTRFCSAARWYVSRGLFPNQLAGFAASSGLIFYGQVREAHLRYIAKYGAFEKQITAWIKHHLSSCRDRGVVIDIGANIGWHTLHASQAGSVEKVIACEPDLFNAYLLQRNISANKIDNVLVAPWAIGDTSRFSPFFFYKSSQRGRHSLVMDHGRGMSLVPVRALDETIKMLASSSENSPIHLIKMDVQGADPQVLQGGKQTFSRAQAVITDLSRHLMEAGGYSGGDLYDQFSGFGLSPFLLEDLNLQPVSRERLDQNDVRIHVIWMRR